MPQSPTLSTAHKGSSRPAASHPFLGLIDAATADALRSFLLWAISEAGGNSDSYLKPVGFIPLPNFIRGLSEAQIAAIQ